MFFAHLIGTFNALIVLETIRALKKGPLNSREFGGPLLFYSINR